MNKQLLFQAIIQSNMSSTTKSFLGQVLKNMPTSSFGGGDLQESEGHSRLNLTPTPTNPITLQELLDSGDFSHEDDALDELGRIRGVPTMTYRDLSKDDLNSYINFAYNKHGDGPDRDDVD